MALVSSVGNSSEFSSHQSPDSLGFIPKRNRLLMVNIVVLSPTPLHVENSMRAQSGALAFGLGADAGECQHGVAGFG
ncbi:hypothetical protein DL764_009615 [Monosporascus ibericus]|uniref:Uncharacterized protein n=1 Tax=Monosporascus ibericus TaxID=155417 RepID=A0A4Q4SWL9_9PEZI|nr:hypothetical protein DL764_009615 [Monosporascus ibericus]